MYVQSILHRPYCTKPEQSARLQQTRSMSPHPSTVHSSYYILGCVAMCEFRCIKWVYKGSSNMRSSSLSDHSKCNDHIVAVELMRQQAVMKRHTDTALEASSDKLGSQLMVAFYMAKNYVPSIQFDKLTERHLQTP